MTLSVILTSSSPLSSCFYSWTSDLDRLNTRYQPEMISMSKKAELQSHIYLLHNLHKPTVVQCVYQPEWTFWKIHFKLPNERHFGLILSFQNDITPFILWFRFKYIWTVNHTLITDSTEWTEHSKTRQSTKKPNRMLVLKLNYFNLTHHTLKTGLMKRDTIKQNEAAHLYAHIDQPQSVYINLIDCKVSLSLGKAIDKINKQTKNLANRIQGHILFEWSLHL